VADAGLREAGSDLKATVRDISVGASLLAMNDDAVFLLFRAATIREQARSHSLIVQRRLSLFLQN
jgi:hypothetical protein